MRLLIFNLVFFGMSFLAHAENVNVVLKVTYKSGATVVQPSDQYVVDNLHSVVTKFPEARIYVLGHTDSSGSDVTNQVLSEKRASLIYKKLIESGSLGSKISVKGLGERAPIADNTTSHGRSKNRRVVVTFTNLDDQKVADLKSTLANTKGMTVLKKESDLVNSFIGKKEALAIQAEKNKLKSKKPVAIAPAVAAPVVAAAAALGQSKLRYRLASGVYYNVLDAEDRDSGNAEAEWVSELNVPFGGEVQYKVSKFWLGVKAFGHIQDYQTENNPNYTWDEETPFLFRGSLVADYETKRLGLSFDIDFNQESFIYENLGNIVLEKELFIGATLGAKYKWLEGTWSSRVGLDLSYPAVSTSSDIDSKGELGYVVSLDFRRANVIGTHGLSAKVYYGFRNFSNTQNDQSEEVLGLMLSLDSLAWL